MLADFVVFRLKILSLYLLTQKLDLGLIYTGNSIKESLLLTCINSNMFPEDTRLYE